MLQQQYKVSAAASSAAYSPVGRPYGGRRCFKASSHTEGCLGAELHSLVRDMAGCDKSILQNAEIVKTVKCLASGGASKELQYTGDPQGMSALVQLLSGHVSSEQHQALAAAAAAAAAAPPELTALEELSLLLQEPLVKTALSRIRCEPELGLNSYGSNPVIHRALQLLDQVLTEDPHTGQVVEFLLAATTAKTAEKQQRQQEGNQHLQEPATPLWIQLEQLQQQHQKQRQLARTAVIARSANSNATSGSHNSNGSNTSGSSGRGAAAKRP